MLARPSEPRRRRCFSWVETESVALAGAANAAAAAASVASAAAATTATAVAADVAAAVAAAPASAAAAGAVVACVGDVVVVLAVAGLLCFLIRPTWRINFSVFFDLARFGKKCVFFSDCCSMCPRARTAFQKKVRPACPALCEGRSDSDRVFPNFCVISFPR